MNIRTWFKTLGMAAVAIQTVGGLPAAAMQLMNGPGAAAVEPLVPAGACGGSAVALPSGHDNLIDINSAPKDWLESLPGIDDSAAAKIINDRPYQMRDDLINKDILPPSAYNQIKNRIIVRRT